MGKNSGFLNDSSQASFFVIVVLCCPSPFVSNQAVDLFGVFPSSEHFGFLECSSQMIILITNSHKSSNCLRQVIRDNKAQQQPFPTEIWRWTRCSIIVECSLTEINLRRANDQSPPLESALIDWHGVLSGTEQSWNNYSNLCVEWWSSMCSGAEVSGAQHWSACHDNERQ